MDNANRSNATNGMVVLEIIERAENGTFGAADAQFLRAMADRLATWPGSSTPSFESAEALAAWLDGLMETAHGSDSVTNRQWEPAQRAARFLRSGEAVPVAFVSAGAQRIATERQRILVEEGRTTESDLEYPQGTLATAAACYALPINHAERVDAMCFNTAPGSWPWRRKWWKPGRIVDAGDGRPGMARADRIRELEKAGALIACEIDVLLAREAAETGSGTHRCDVCGNVGTPDPIVGCKKCGFDNMQPRGMREVSGEPLRREMGFDDVGAFLTEVRAEIESARAKFPDSRLTMIALAEEHGELAKAVLGEPAERVRAEAAQVASMAARVVLDGDRSVDCHRARHGLDEIGGGAE